MPISGTDDKNWLVDIPTDTVYALGMAQRFKSVDSNLKHRNGQYVTVTETITEASDEFDAEVLPMMRVRFPDGFTTEVWPDELTQHGADTPRHRDLL